MGITRGVIFKNRLEKSFRWFSISTSTAALGLLLQLRFYQPFVLASFLSILLISAFGEKFENKNFFPVLIFMPWFLFIITFFKVSFTEAHMPFVIAFQILSFGGLIYYFSGYLFEYLWNFKKGWLREKWNSASRETLDKRYNEIRFGVIFLPFFHFFLGSLSIFQKYFVLTLEQFGIGLLFFILLLWVVKNRKQIQNEPKKIAAAIFLFLLIMFTFDSILTEILYLTNNPYWIPSAYSTSLILISVVRVLISV